MQCEIRRYFHSFPGDNGDIINTVSRVSVSGRGATACPCPPAQMSPQCRQPPRHHHHHHHQHQRCGHTTVDINDENNCGLQRSSSTLISPYKIWSMSFLSGVVVVGYLVAAAPGPFTRCPSPCPEMESGPGRGHPGHLAAVHRALSSVFRSCAMCDRLAALFSEATCLFRLKLVGSS